MTSIVKKHSLNIFISLLFPSHIEDDWAGEPLVCEDEEWRRGTVQLRVRNLAFTDRILT